MNIRIQSLHHVTATVGNAQEDLDFYVRLLGLRLVKKTVNCDNPGVYHFYYGDERGSPGTLMTTFPYEGHSVRVGTKGAGQVTRTAFSVPPGSLDFWRERLAAHSVEIREEGERFGEPLLAFDDPSGLLIELIGSEEERTPWQTEELWGAEAIRGIHSATLTVRDLAPTQHLLHDVLGLEPVEREGARTRFAAGKGQPGHFVDVVEDPDAPRAINGIGTVHHIALAIGTDEEQLTLREELLQQGLEVTDVRDRQYFQSIYFREPGGVLLEVATLGPGFLVDEDLPTLGQALKLPPWEETQRSRIEATLPPVDY